MARITLVRHAQASFAKRDYDALSELGFAQARHLGRLWRLQRESADVLASGTLRRHVETAQACAQAAGWTAPLRTLPAFDEFDHVDVLERFDPAYRERLKGAPDLAAAFRPLFRDAMRRWASGAHDADYAESWRAFGARSRAAVDSFAATLPGGDHAVVFTSGGVIATIAQGLLGLADEATLDLDWRLVNGGITRLTAGPGGLRLASLNESGHFAGRFAHLATWR